MPWFAAHLVLYVRIKAQPQQRFPLWENIVLLRADSEDEAFEKAERRGQEDAGDDDGTFRWGGKPAEWVFAGVRKLTLCQDERRRPNDGTEISFLELEADSKETIAKFLQGEAVSLRIVEKFRAVASP